MMGKFTKRAQEALQASQQVAAQLGHGYVGTEHILLGLIRVEESVAAKALKNQGVSEEDIINKLKAVIGSGDISIAEPQDFTPRAKRILEMSFREALKMGTGYIGTEHLLLALLREQDSIAVKLLISMGINPQSIYDDIMAMLGESNKGQGGITINNKVASKVSNSDTPTLDQFS
ncbi:MAG TPA: Clp protease N-terminal domain-containing protein, partial [Defluviitaleaceae bacterium]|nr:Clp protease N-terminal domain-containing protein [Defluviitaleaceae bacterium]